MRGARVFVATMVALCTWSCGSDRPPLLGSDSLIGNDQDSGVGSSGFGGSSNPANTQSCTTETQFVYVITADNRLYRFDPPSVTFTLIGTMDCPSSSSPFSMAVDRNGDAWVVFVDGHLFKMNTSDASCQATSFVPGQNGFTTFGMGFSSNSAGSTDETLFVSESPFDLTSGEATNQLAMIDTNSLTLSVIGTYDKLGTRAEMTGSGDGKLYAAFEGTPYVVAEIDKTNANVISEAPQTPINYPPDSSNFAFAFWGGDFWLFVGPGGATDVFHYQPITGQTTKIATEEFEIVGAGVSTCAPTVAPK